MPLRDTPHTHDTMVHKRHKYLGTYHGSVIFILNSIIIKLALGVLGAAISYTGRATQLQVTATVTESTNTAGPLVVVHSRCQQWGKYFIKYPKLN